VWGRGTAQVRPQLSKISKCGSFEVQFFANCLFRDQGLPLNSSLLVANRSTASDMFPNQHYFRNVVGYHFRTGARLTYTDADLTIVYKAEVLCSTSVENQSARIDFRLSRLILDMYPRNDQPRKSNLASGLDNNTPFLFILGIHNILKASWSSSHR
jgi:hypothetical protein